MVNVLKAKKYYIEHKYETSVDFSEIRAQMSKADDHVEHSLSPFELTEKVTAIGRTVLELKRAVDAHMVVRRRGQQELASTLQEEGGPPLVVKMPHRLSDAV